jgi:hypothetical protein
LSKFGNGTLKQNAYEYLTDLKGDHEVSQIVLCQEVAIVLAALIEEIKSDASISSIIATARQDERNRIRNSI